MKNKTIVNVLVLTNNQDDDVSIIVEDGGYATFHNNGEGMLATYHQSRLVNQEDIYAETDEGKQYNRDNVDVWTVTPEMIIEALKWLVVGYEYEFAIITRNVDLCENIDSNIRDFLFVKPIITVNIPNPILNLLDNKGFDTELYSRRNLIKEYISNNFIEPSHEGTDMFERFFEEYQ